MKKMVYDIVYNLDNILYSINKPIKVKQEL